VVVGFGHSSPELELERAINRFASIKVGDILKKGRKELTLTGTDHWQQSGCAKCHRIMGASG